MLIPPGWNLANAWPSLYFNNLLFGRELPDVFIPLFRFLGYKHSHQILTFLIIQYDHLNAAAAQKVFFSLESFILAYDDTRNLIQQDSPGAHAARTGSQENSLEYRYMYHT